MGYLDFINFVVSCMQKIEDLGEKNPQCYIYIYVGL